VRANSKGLMRAVSSGAAAALRDEISAAVANQLSMSPTASPKNTYRITDSGR
jgi:hypothetical protein